MIEKQIAKSQEQKLFIKDLPAVTNNLQTYQLGSEIIKGEDFNTRIGNMIRVKGVRVQWYLENQGDNTTWTTPCKNIYLHMGFVQNLKGSNNPANYWYISDTVPDVPVAHSTVLLDAQRFTTRKNTADIRWIGKEKIIKITSPYTNDNMCKPFKTGSWYQKIDHDIQFEDGGATVPYARVDVKPEIYFYWYFSLPQVNATLTTPVIAQDVKLYIYFRE